MSKRLPRCKACGGIIREQDRPETIPGLYVRFDAQGSAPSLIAFPLDVNAPEYERDLSDRFILIRKAPGTAVNLAIETGGDPTPAPDSGVNYAKLTNWAAGRGQYVTLTGGARLQFAALADRRAQEWDIRAVMFAIDLGRQTLPWEREVPQ